MVIVETGWVNRQTNEIETSRVELKGQTLDKIFHLIYDNIFRIVGDLDEWNDFVRFGDIYDSDFDHYDNPEVDSHEWYCYMEGKIQTLKLHTEEYKRIVNYWEEFLTVAE